MVATHKNPKRAAIARTEKSAAIPAPQLKKSPVKGRAFGVLVLLMIPGFLLATSLPALAVGEGAPAETMSLTSGKQRVEGLQSVAVSKAAAVTVERGEFTAETHDQLVARQRAAALAQARAQARAGAYRTVGPAAAGDDYPWRASGGGLSPLGYVTRQCTDFAAWRLNRDRGTTGPFSLTWANMTPGRGSAGGWASAWNSHGWQTSNVPIPGAIAWTSSHVAYVKSVNGDGTVNLEEYNWGGSASYHTRTVAFGAVSLYLYPPP